MDDPLRVALVGYGLAGRVFHAPLIGAVPGLRVSHVVTSDDGRRAAAAGDLPGAVVVDRPAELWDRGDDFDVVVVANANVGHVPVASAAIELGKPTVVDKPLATEAGQARWLADLAARRGVPLTVFQNRRWDSDTLTVRRLLGDGVLGEVVRFESRFTRFRPQVSDRWRESDPAAGGGLLLDLGSHLVDQAIHLFGPVERVWAEVDVRRPGGTADDDCFIALQHAAGVRSHLWCSSVAPVPGPRVVVQGLAAGYRKAELDGQEEALRAGRTPNGSDWGEEPPGVFWDGAGERPVPSERGAWPAYYQAVLAMARDGAPAPVDPYDAVRVLEVLEAARASVAPLRPSVAPLRPKE